MNSTFTRDDETEAAAVQNRTFNKEEAPESMEVNGGGQSMEEEREETLLGYTRAEIIVMKHALPLYKNIIQRLLHSNEFEVRRCATGEIISKGRCSITPNGVFGGIANEEHQKVIKERDEARAEAEKQHASCATLFNSYDQMRRLAFTMRDERMDAADKLKMAVAEIDEWQAKFYAVKRNAEEELDKASIDYENLLKENEENTKGLRLKVKRLEVEQAGKDEEVRVLKKKVEDLAAICDQLLTEVDVSDSMSQLSVDA